MIMPVNNPEQVDIVVNLASEIWTGHYTPIIGPDQVNYMLTNFQSFNAINRQINHEGFSYYLICHQDNPIGYFAIVQREAALFLSKLYVKSDQRGRGYGRAAIDFIANRARELQLPKISLTVNKYNTASIQFYQKSGFILMGPVVQDIGNGYIMDDYVFEMPV